MGEEADRWSDKFRWARVCGGREGCAGGEQLKAVRARVSFHRLNLFPGSYFQACFRLST